MKNLKDYLIKESKNIQYMLDDKDISELFDYQQYWDKHDFEITVVPNIPGLIENIKMDVIDSGKYWTVFSGIAPEDDELDSVIPADDRYNAIFDYDTFADNWNSLSKSKQAKILDIINNGSEYDD